MVQTSGDADCINFSMCSSSRAAIGRYKLSLQVTCGNQVATRFLGKFVLLFNPWCSGEEEGRACLPPLPAQPSNPRLLSALSCQQQPFGGTRPGKAGARRAARRVRAPDPSLS